MNNQDLINKRTFKRAQKNHIFMKWAFGNQPTVNKSLQLCMDNHCDLYTPQKGETIRYVVTNIYKKSHVWKFRTTEN